MKVVMDGTLIVEVPGPRTIPQLAMSRGANGIPSPTGDAEPMGWWIAGACMFSAMSEFADRENNGTIRVEMQTDDAALAVVEARLIAIVSGTPEKPSAWLSWPLDSLAVTTAGSRGLVRKRPGGIRIDRRGGADADGDSLALKSVSRYWSHSNRQQPWQEASLVEALTATQLPREA
jgi:hypothetical protein